MISPPVVSQGQVSQVPWFIRKCHDLSAGDRVYPQVTGSVHVGKSGHLANGG